MVNETWMEYEKKLVKQKSLSGIISLESFEEWKQAARQQEIVKKLADTLPDYAPSPEEILEERERLLGLTKLYNAIADKIGHDGMKLLNQYHIRHIPVADIAKEIGVDERTIYRALAKLKADAAAIVKKKFRKQYELLSRTWFPMQPVKGFPTILPFEFEKDRVDSTYKYQGTVRFRSKCKLPEYFREAFCDDLTRCGVCVDKYGVNTCKREGDN